MTKCKKPMRAYALGGALYDNDSAYQSIGRLPQRMNAAPRYGAQKDPINALTNQINMGNAIENSNLTMSEKAALGLGTTSADASALRSRTSALSTLRDGLSAQQPQQDDSPWIGGGMGDPLNSTWNAPGVTYGARSFADGGVIGIIQNRKNVIDTAIDEATNPHTKRPVPAQITEPAMASMGSDADDYAAQAARIEAEQQAAAKARMAQQPKKKGLFGFANGGKIEGNGTPTSDSIPARVKETGEPILVSTQERIVSRDQDALLQKIAHGIGFKNLDAMLEAGTGKKVGPTLKHGKRAAAFGGRIGEDPENPTPSQLYGTRMFRPSLAPSPEQQASYANAADEFKKQRGIVPPATSLVAKPSIGELPPLGDAPMMTADSPKTVAPLQEKPQPAIAGTASMRGKTVSIPRAPSAADGYVDAQGKPVQKWEQTARYAEAMSVNDRMSKLARQMERDRYGRDMGADITNPRVQDLAQLNLGRMDKEDERQQRGQMVEQQGVSAGLDQQIKRNSLAQSAQEQQLIAKLNDPNLTPEQRLAMRSDLLVMKGKNPNEHRFYVGEDETTDPTGSRTKKSVLLDALAPEGRMASVSKTVVPKVGEVRSGYRFKGGDPAKQANWEKA